MDHINEQIAAAATAMPDLRSLMALDDAEFVAATYPTLLRRQADSDGLAHYTAKLRAGHTKLEVLALVRDSREGRAKGIQLPGLDRALSRYKLGRVPILGACVRWLAGLESHTAAARRQRAIEQHLLRQERAMARHQEQMAAEFAALHAALTQGVMAAASGTAYSDQLIWQRKGETPSVLSKFIKLQRAPAEDVIAQLGELVQASLEAERLAVDRGSR